MDLARHAEVLWRFRRVTVAGVLVGALLALLAAFEVSPSGISPRGSETWAAVSSILVTQPGFPEGRVTLPQAPVEQALETDGERSPGDELDVDKVEFADPARLAALGDLYAKFVTSDTVLRRVPGRPTAEEIQASPFASSQGGLLLPVVQLTAKAPGKQAAERLNRQAFEALKGYINDQQASNGIPLGRRVELRLLAAPKAKLEAGRKYTAPMLAFLVTVLAAVALAHLLQSLRDRRTAAAMDMDPWAGSPHALHSDPLGDPDQWTPVGPSAGDHPRRGT